MNNINGSQQDRARINYSIQQSSGHAQNDANNSIDTTYTLQFDLSGSD